MSSVLVDSHVNLHSDKYEIDEIDEIVSRARDAGVRYMLTISDQLGSTDAIAKIAERYAGMWRSVGVHPHYAKDAPSLTARDLIERCQSPDVIGVGECGLDFYYEYSDRSAQEKVFSAHIEAAQETGLPLIIHTRDADDLMQSMLEKAFAKKTFVPLLHCYTSGEKLARAALEMQGYISFSGIVTFKNAASVRDIVGITPPDRLIIETDCPYLAPVPMRGRRNEPAYLAHIADYLAPMLELESDQFAELTTDNFFRLFSRAIRDDEAVNKDMACG